MNYLVWSVRMAAWWGKGAVWTSTISDAQAFTRDHAIDFCRARYGQADGLQCFPVARDDLTAVMQK